MVQNFGVFFCKDFKAKILERTKIKAFAEKMKGAQNNQI